MRLLAFKTTILSLLGLTFLTACDRHSEDQVRAALTRWFNLGDAVYFFSDRNCTAAMYKTRGNSIKSALRLQNDATRALIELDRSGVMAMSVRDQTPDQVFLDVMNERRSTGVYIQAAAIGARDCMDEATEGAFHAALSNPAASFVWHRDESALVLLDPGQNMVFWASGGG